MFYTLGRQSTHNANTVCFGSLDFVGTQCSISFGSLDFVGTVIHSITVHTTRSISLDFVGTVIHITHNANRVFYKLRLCRDTTQTECSISFGSLDFVGTVIHSTHNAFYKLGLCRDSCRDSNTQYTQRKQGQQYTQRKHSVLYAWTL